MTHDELLAKLDDKNFNKVWANHQLVQDVRSALRAVVELHKPHKIPNWVPTNKEFNCDGCAITYPCPTIQAIEENLHS